MRLDYLTKGPRKTFSIVMAEFEIRNKHSKNGFVANYDEFKFEGMNDYEESRRKFLTKLGLAIGTSLVVSEKLSATVLNNKSEYALTTDQQKFMSNYEKWMNNFISAIKAQRENPDDMNAKQNIMDLSEEADNWKDKLAGFMKDDNFARYYMIVTEKMTKEIY